MRVPKKHPKNLSKNRFWEPFWPPKPLQNQRQIDIKSMLKTNSKKMPKKCQHEPTWETCLSKEREARKCIRAAKAFTSKGKQENARRSKGKQEKQGKGSKSKKQQQPKQQNQKQNATHSNTQQRPGQATVSPTSLINFSKAQQSSAKLGKAQQSIANPTKPSKA